MKSLLAHTIQVIILLRNTLLNSKIVRAILNLPLGKDSKVAGIMVNLVGEEGFQVK
jgi:hypothetical protein